MSVFAEDCSYRTLHEETQNGFVCLLLACPTFYHCCCWPFFPQKGTRERKTLKLSFQYILASDILALYKLSSCQQPSSKPSHRHHSRVHTVCQLWHNAIHSQMLTMSFILCCISGSSASQETLWASVTYSLGSKLLSSWKIVGQNTAKVLKEDNNNLGSEKMGFTLEWLWSIKLQSNPSIIKQGEEPSFSKALTQRKMLMHTCS